MTQKSHDVLATLTKEDFPVNFRRIRLELAREKDHPVGSASSGYIVIAPLDSMARIDSATWREHRELCRVVRFRPDEADSIGHLIRRPGGSWAFHYDVEGAIDDEAGHRLETESFVTGEYISIMEEHGPRTFQVASVEHI